VEKVDTKGITGFIILLVVVIAGVLLASWIAPKLKAT